MIEDFKKFIMRGNLVDLAIGFTVGAAFSVFARSLVEDILMPPIALLTGGVDFSDRYLLLRAGNETPPPYATLGDAEAAGAVTLNWGLFLNAALTLFLVALAMFAIIKIMNRLHEALDESPQPAGNQPKTKRCTFCKEVIDIAASRCAHCTSQLPSS